MTAMTADPVSELLAAVRETIEAHDLLPRAAAATSAPEPIIVGVSGGPDSVALLHVLDRLSKLDGAPAFLLNIHPVVAHLNHGLRGAAADEDQRFVEDLARRLGLPCEVGRAETRAEADAAGLGIEEAGRLARRRFLAEVARRRGARLIALGHHADDRAETVLFHILRGTGVEGLAALGPRSTVAADEEEASRGGSPDLPRTPIEIVRPLIAVRRDLILAYLEHEGLAYREDATNSSDAYTRNRIRGELLPLLREKFNPKVDEALVRLADQAASVGDVLAQALDATWHAVVREVPGTSAVVIDADDFAALAPWLQGAILRRAIERLGGGLKYMSAERTREVVSALLAKSVAGPIDLPGHLVASRRRRAIRIERRV
jgi:tRNA(Ile)-lysidine synthase